MFLLAVGVNMQYILYLLLIKFCSASFSRF